MIICYMLFFTSQEFIQIYYNQDGKYFYDFWNIMDIL